MGIAELIPGVSSGTIAFVVGLYAPLCEAISKVDTHALHLAVTFKWKTLSRYLPWRFLIALLMGMGVAILGFTHLIHYCLNHPTARSGLHALFLGLILASAIYCLKQVRRRSLGNTALFLVATLATCLFVMQPGGPSIGAPLRFSTEGVWLARVFFSGMLAVFAMMLPGISGSYLLHIMGLYPFVITAIRLFTEGAFSWNVPVDILAFLSVLAAGILVGVLLFARLIAFALRVIPDQTVSFFAGIMLGASPSLWPFWEWQYVQVGNNQALLTPSHAYMPAYTTPLLWISLSLFAVGLLTFYALEKWSKRNPIDVSGNLG